MARGWESKDVESQVEIAIADRGRRVQRLNPEADALRQRREHLELSRRRVVLDLEASRHPRHREQLQRALAFLDAELKKLDGPSPALSPH
jgi:hypothetical protein